MFNRNNQWSMNRGPAFNNGGQPSLGSGMQQNQGLQYLPQQAYQNAAPQAPFQNSYGNQSGNMPIYQNEASPLPYRNEASPMQYRQQQRPMSVYDRLEEAKRRRMMRRFRPMPPPQFGSRWGY